MLGVAQIDLGSRVLSDLPQLGGASALLQKAKGLCLFVSFVYLCFIRFLMLGSEVQIPRLDSQGRGLFKL